MIIINLKNYSSKLVDCLGKDFRINNVNWIVSELYAYENSMSMNKLNQVKKKQLLIEYQIQPKSNDIHSKSRINWRKKKKSISNDY